MKWKEKLLIVQIGRVFLKCCMVHFIVYKSKRIKKNISQSVCLLIHTHISIRYKINEIFV